MKETVTQQLRKAAKKTTSCRYPVAALKPLNSKNTTGFFSLLRILAMLLAALLAPSAIVAK